jgi:hypothetical protein
MSMESTGNINWAFGDGGDVEDLVECAERYNYTLCADGKWRETDDEPGFTDQEMWRYVEEARESDAEDLARYGFDGGSTVYYD